MRWLECCPAALISHRCAADCEGSAGDLGWSLTSDSLLIDNVD